MRQQVDGQSGDDIELFILEQFHALEVLDGYEPDIANNAPALRIAHVRLQRIDGGNVGAGFGQHCRQ